MGMGSHEIDVSSTPLCAQSAVAMRTRAEKARKAVSKFAWRENPTPS